MCLKYITHLSSGEIIIDEQSIISVTQESLRANISVIPQDITMFHRSILENLQLAKYDASIDEIVSACKKSQSTHILHMVHDYNPIVGERGQG